MPSIKRLSTLHLSTARSWRGGENQLLLLAQGLQERGHQALILAPKDAPLHPRAREAGVPARILTFRSEIDPAGMWRLGRILRECKLDVLHLHDAHAVLPGQVAGRALPGNKLKIFAHRRTAFRIKSRWKYGGRVDRIIAISQAVKEKVLEAGISEDRVSVVHSGILFNDEECTGQEAATFRKEHGIPETALLVSHAAALTAEKRQADIIEAIRICKKQGKEIFLALAGSGPLEETLRTQVRQNGIGDRVAFLGFRKNLSLLWAAADIVVFASEAEGLCTALIEAQGAGLPAVVTQVGGMVEVVQEAETGLFVPPFQPHRIAEALQHLHDAPEIRSSMSRDSRLRARKYFSSESMVEQTIEVYTSEWSKP